LIPSTSQRLPQKTCGLFDTGFAGDAADVASLGLGVDSDIDQSLFTFGDPGPSTSQEPSNDDTKYNIPETVDATLDDWNFDLLDPLGDLEDPLGDSHLDAFINLETLLGENSFGGSSQMKVESAEVDPVIRFDATDLAVPVSDKLVPQTVASNQVVKPTRKRKAAVSSLDDNLFKIPDPMTYDASDSFEDHNYITKSDMVASPCESTHKTKVIGKGKKGTLKRKRVASTASDCSEVSSTSSNFETDDQTDCLDKQSIRRIKNNIASKRSREQRKQKFVDMDNEAEELEKANDVLRNKIVELEKLAKEMKELLVAKMSGKA